MFDLLQPHIIMFTIIGYKRVSKKKPLILSSMFILSTLKRLSLWMLPVHIVFFPKHLGEIKRAVVCHEIRNLFYFNSLCLVSVSWWTSILVRNLLTYLKFPSQRTKTKKRFTLDTRIFTYIHVNERCINFNWKYTNII